MDNHGSASLSQSDSRDTVLHGVVLGFFFPIIPYFFFHESKPAVFWEDGSEHEVVDRPVFSYVYIPVSLQVLADIYRL